MTGGNKVYGVAVKGATKARRPSVVTRETAFI